MRRKTVLRFGIAVAAILVMASIAIGALQADEELRGDKDSPTPTPTVVAISQPDPEATPEPVVYVGSDIMFQVRGGDDPCRFLYMNNRVGTFSGGEIVLKFVAGTWDDDLAESGEMDLYGPNGPHRFYFKDSTGQATAMIDVPHGATVYHTITFPEPGVYYLYNRLAAQLGAIAEVVARPVGQPGSAVKTDWCP